METGRKKTADLTLVTDISSTASGRGLGRDGMHESPSYRNILFAWASQPISDVPCPPNLMGTLVRSRQIFTFKLELNVYCE